MEDILQRYFGYETFRTGQRELISFVLDNESALGILPTGGGKSICYQVPGIIKGGLTLVISPLISLMKDQVDTLNASGISAAYLNSNLKAAEEREIMTGLAYNRYQFLYVAPERFNQLTFRQMLNQLDIKLIAFDEAHCISKWGHDFRPSYRQVINFIGRFSCPFLAVTATATVDVKKDIQSLLNIADDHVIETSTGRDNLAFKVDPTYQKEKMVREYVSSHRHDSGIIYAGTRKQVEALSEQFNHLNIDHTLYHAGLPKAEREENQAKFVNDDCPVMIATNAFGMGIDKSNVRYVIHYNMPQDLESYYQEAGRAGRDGLDSECILLFSDQDIRLQQFFISTSDEAIQEKKKEKLEKMVHYTKTTQCLQGTIINYFNPDEHLQPCGKCGNCLRQGSYNMTTEALKILSCLIRMKEPVNRLLLIKVLRGEDNHEIKDYHYHQLSTFGLLKDYETKDISRFIDTLLFNGYIHEVNGRMICHPSAKEVIMGQTKVMTHYEPINYKEKVTIKTVTEVNEQLFSQLKKVRKQLASELNVPPFTIFSDHTLTLFAKKMPTTKQEMIHIEGVGSYKLKHYCPQFIDCINDYLSVAR
ncbi:DNA helicase RecQ [Macrococcus equipercicus]|uniref:DNA helicase RecQ n=1 Tax=Macrococcus equipercicus TaxID=69967 RepID=A0ABQ6RB80_9STAP|nr:DNA helicase RecQ [Macrococcus equipercicus]KAA1042424.1 DNA helicase RecQ [Macrococcus equipercicus]